MVSDFVQVIESVLPEGWMIDDPSMAPDCLLVCPCGNVIEMDGTCPQGCVSPLRDAGLI